MGTAADGIVSRGLPPKSGDTLQRTARVNPYGELIVHTIIPDMNALADEGSYFTATNPTPGTAINYSITAAFSDTAAMFSIFNRDGGSAIGKRIYLDYIRVIAGATVPATATSGQYAVKLDQGGIRQSAGTLVVPANSNIDVGTASIADVRYTPTVAAASAAARLVDRGVMRSVIPVANDEWIFSFGSVEKAAGISLGGAVAQRMIIPCPPLVIGPAEMGFLHVWFPGNATTAGQFEFAAGWWER
jgi:hypothetical protein